MKTFKTLSRQRPTISEIAPDGRLLLAYPNGDVHQWHNEKWDVVPSLLDQGVSNLRRPLHVIMDTHDLRPEVVNFETPHNVTNGYLCSLNLATGEVIGKASFKWPLTFYAAPFGMVMSEFQNSAQTHTNLYIAEWDWTKNYRSAATMKFKLFTEECTYQFFGFNNDPKRCVYALMDGANPRAGMLIRKGTKITDTSLDLPKRWRMLCGLTVTDALTVGLIGNKNDATGKVIRFYRHGKFSHDFNLPFRAHALHTSPDCLTLSAIGFQEVTQIDLEV